jgi:hypothetical protein
VRPTDSSVYYTIWVASPVEVAIDGTSCLAILQAAKAAGKSVADGLYTIKPSRESESYQVYCDMHHGGYTLVATVANGDAQHWTYNSADGDRGQMSSLWESGATLGTVSENTPSTNADFKSEAFNSVKGTSIMIKYKNNFLLSTNSGCISDSLHNTLNAYRFACGGSEGLSGASSVCGHSCTVKQAVAINDPALLRGSSASFLYIKGKIYFVYGCITAARYDGHDLICCC